MANLTQPHVFTPRRKGSQCSLCGGWADAYYHNQELFTDADRDREKARLEYEAGELTKEMRRPLGDVSKKAGLIERESPLFYGSGSNPTLF
jgi:hypothetical protein